MKFHMYSFCSIDTTWVNLPTVKDYIKEHFFKEQLWFFGNGPIDGSFYEDLHVSITEANGIAESLKKCLEYSREHMCWDGTFQQEPRIFFIPGLPGMFAFSYGFAWKITDNGATFIASPVEMPWIEEYYGCFFEGVLDTTIESEKDKDTSEN